MIKLKPTDTKPIQIHSFHRHPLNDLVLYTTSQEQAKALHAQSEKWIPLVSSHLTLHNPVHIVVVHGIPTPFNPTNPQHMSMLKAMNPDTLEPAPLFVKWISPNAFQQGATHSSIRIGFAETDQAKRAVETKVFYGRFNKKTEFGRKNKPRCMNCLEDSHITRYYRAKLMCPYCAKPHTADKCDLHGRLTTKCTACARQMQKADPAFDLNSIFAETPRHLRHSPLDPTCPARIAEKLAQVVRTEQRQETLPAQGPSPPLTEAVEVLPRQNVNTAPPVASTSSPTADKDTNMNHPC